MMNKLTILKECTVWGYLTPTLLRDLMMKRGRIASGKEQLPLNDNNLIEEKLGNIGIICLEDLIHELTDQNAANFKTVSNFILPFQLSLPEGGKRAVVTFPDKKLQPGFRKEDDFSKLVQAMV